MSQELQKIVNSMALKRAESQYRLAQLFTPYGFEAERADYDRVADFMDNLGRAFPQPTPGLLNSLARIEGNLREANAVLAAFSAQGLTPSLTDDQLFVTARNNVIGQRSNTAAFRDAESAAIAEKDAEAA